jgi:Mg/Co/Ni transporter MgtE
MAGQQKPDVRRGEMAFIFAIVLGLAVGILIKKVRIGILIGLVLGIMIVLTGWLRSTRK